MFGEHIREARELTLLRFGARRGNQQVAAETERSGESGRTGSIDRA